VLETLHTGKPIRESRGDIARGLDGIRFYAASARNMRGETIPVSNDFHSYTVREPVGIVACIVPWNVPFVLMVSKAAPALAGGNSVVVKPATAHAVHGAITSRSSGKRPGCRPASSAF